LPAMDARSRSRKTALQFGTSAAGSSAPSSRFASARRLRPLQSGPALVQSVDRSTLKSFVHRQGTHHWRPGRRRLADLRWPPGRQAFDSWNRGRRHQRGRRRPDVSVFQSRMGQYRGRGQPEMGRPGTSPWSPFGPVKTTSRFEIASHSCAS